MRNEIDHTLGASLRKLRLSRGLSLATVAAGTGISQSFLSLVETGKHDITVGRLMRVTQFFGVSITDLIPGQATADPAVVRQPERLHIHSASEGIEIYLLSPDTRRTMMPVLIDYEPGATPAEYSQHPGEEFICVIEGSLELELAGSDTIVLHEGDSAYYASTREHRYRNVADGRSRVFVVLSPPAL